MHGATIGFITSPVSAVAELSDTAKYNTKIMSVA